ncbi:MAG TPA: FG-GAP-like repeat-containing protein, partial [Planctomycetota bacterium]|nr:FG-GAP-like repeat-containing protein [Planctomycetota bacterium]
MPRIVLTDEAAARGLDYVNRSGEAAKRTILEANGAGVALLDLQHDGDLDVVFSQGLASLAAVATGPGADLEVFLNDGAGRFSRGPGPGLSGWWTGLATGDVDGDGDTDLAAGGYGGLEVLLQGADGRLAPAPQGSLVPAGVSGARLVPGAPREQGAIPWWSTSLALADFDRDGALDLYVGQYLALDPTNPPLGHVGDGALGIPCRWKGQTVFCGPHGLDPQRDRVLFGRGDGSFEDRTASALQGQVPGYALGVMVFDADSDGDDDVYVAHDSVANVLWINDGAGHFVDRAYVANVALSIDGAPEAGMGVAFGDVDRDGSFDFALTNFSGEPTELYFGARVGFDNRTHRLGLGRATLALLSWSAHLADFDADGALELFTANGHVYPQADAPGTGTSYGQAATLWRLP